LLLGVIAFFYVFTDIGIDGKIPEAPIQSAQASPLNVEDTETKVDDKKQDSSSGVMSKISDAISAATFAAEYATGKFKPNSEITVPIKGWLKVYVIDSKTICLAGAYDDFLNERFVAECGSFLKGVESNTANLASWSKNLFYNILGAEIILKYRPVIAAAYQNPEAFAISPDIKIKEGGYWIEPAGQAQFTDMKTGEPKLTRNAFVRHYAFLKLDAPLEEGKTYAVKNPLCEEVPFKYVAVQNLSGIIKVNQAGYAPQAPRKYAYAGAWLGTLGALDISALEGQSFYLCDAASGKQVYTGVLKSRGHETYYKDITPFTGEVVMELDFSDFAKEGTYYAFIPALGRSYDFAIGNAAIGEAFYVHMKGLYHKRCGIAKEKPYTNWLMSECHMHTYVGGFPPNNNHYRPDKNRSDCGFFDAQGKPVDFEVSQFKLIDAIKTDIMLPLHGGWHDAADYDRRPYHYDVVNDLLSAYLMRPQNFADGQLNIPESANGIPDILDEASWGMALWLNAQNSDGSVGGWIEATSHPVDYNPSTDTQRYYLSAATMESTMQYAAHASMLALALKKAGADVQSNKYADSAVKAYDWASDPSHRFIKSYPYPVSQTNSGGRTVVAAETLTYKEAPSVPNEYVFKASYNLYLLTGKAEYLKRAAAVNDMSQKFAETSWRINPLLFTELFVYGAQESALSKIYDTGKARMLRYADERLVMLDNNYPYRIAWHDVTHHYVTYMSWGKYHPMNNAKFFMTAYTITKDPKYRAAAYLCNDWHNGANPSGQTMTAGLGKNYPLKYLDLASYADGIAEYIPGITPYRNTFGISQECVKLAFGLIYNPRPERDFAPPPTMLFEQKYLGEGGKDEKALSKAVSKYWPIWRRFANVEAFSVAASEFTVSETIAPAAAVSGWLLEPGWQPSQALKTRKPAPDLKKLEGYAPLP